MKVGSKGWMLYICSPWSSIQEQIHCNSWRTNNLWWIEHAFCQENCVRETHDGVFCSSSTVAHNTDWYWTSWRIETHEKIQYWRSSWKTLSCGRYSMLKQERVWEGKSSREVLWTEHNPLFPTHFFLSGTVCRRLGNEGIKFSLRRKMWSGRYF